MIKPIELIEKDLKYKKGTLEGLKNRLNKEEKEVLSTAVEIQVLEKEIEIFEKAKALLEGVE